MRVYRWPTVQKKLDGISRMSAWRWERDGKMPASFTMGGHVKCWDADEIDAWLERLRDTGRIYQTAI